MVDLGEKLKTLRNEKRLTQAQVAERIGVSKAMVSSYEVGSRLPSYEILVKLACFFGVSTDFLLGVSKRKSLDIEGLTERQIELIVGTIDEYKKHSL